MSSSYRSSASSYTSSSYRPTSSSKTTTYRSSNNYYATPLRLRERPLLTQIYTKLRHKSPTQPSTTAEDKLLNVETKSLKPDSDGQAIIKTTLDTSTSWQNDLTRNISRNKYLIKFREKPTESILDTTHVVKYEHDLQLPQSQEKELLLKSSQLQDKPIDVVELKVPNQSKLIEKVVEVNKAESATPRKIETKKKVELKIVEESKHEATDSKFTPVQIVKQSRNLIIESKKGIQEEKQSADEQPQTVVANSLPKSVKPLKKPAIKKNQIKHKEESKEIKSVTKDTTKEVKTTVNVDRDKDSFDKPKERLDTKQQAKVVTPEDNTERKVEMKVCTNQRPAVAVEPSVETKPPKIPRHEQQQQVQKTPTEIISKSNIVNETAKKKIADVKPKIKTRLYQSSTENESNLNKDTKKQTSDEESKTRPSLVVEKRQDAVKLDSKTLDGQLKPKVAKVRVVKKVGVKNGNKRQLSEGESLQPRVGYTNKGQSVPTINKEPQATSSKTNLDDSNKENCLASAKDVHNSSARKKLAKNNNTNQPVSDEPVTRPISRFREYYADDFNLLCVLGHGGWGYVST